MFLVEEFDEYRVRLINSGCGRIVETSGMIDFGEWVKGYKKK